MLFKKPRLVVIVIAVFFVIVGLFSNLTATLLLNNNSYIYGSLLGVFFILIWMVIEFFLKSFKWFLVIQTLFFIIPFAFFLIWKDNNLINMISLLTLVWAFSICGGIYVKLKFWNNLTGKKVDKQKN